MGLVGGSYTTVSTGGIGGLRFAECRGGIGDTMINRAGRIARVILGVYLLLLAIEAGLVEMNR